MFSSKIFNHFYKSTFGVGDRFENAHSYLRNNPSLRGRLKNYSSSKNIFSKRPNGIIKKNNNFSLINTKRTINPSLSVNIDDSKQRNKKLHNLAKLNNKSSNCITPGTFNPLINYKIEEKKEKPKIRRNYSKNKDHFNHMTPTQRYIYRPHTKQSMYNYYLISQIATLPGRSRTDRVDLKKTGKKKFNNSMRQEPKLKSRNINNNNKNNGINRINTIINNNHRKIRRVYEFDNPIISYRDMNNMNKKQKRKCF